MLLAGSPASEVSKHVSQHGGELVAKDVFGIGIQLAMRPAALGSLSLSAENEPPFQHNH